MTMAASPQRVLWNEHSSNTNANDDHTEDEEYDSSAGIWFGLNEAGENVEVDDRMGALPYDYLPY